MAKATEMKWIFFCFSSASASKRSKTTIIYFIFCYWRLLLLLRLIVCVCVRIYRLRLKDVPSVKKSMACWSFDRQRAICWTLNGIECFNGCASAEAARSRQKKKIEFLCSPFIWHFPSTLILFRIFAFIFGPLSVWQKRKESIFRQFG